MKRINVSIIHQILEVTQCWMTIRIDDDDEYAKFMFWKNLSISVVAKKRNSGIVHRSPDLSQFNFFLRVCLKCEVCTNTDLSSANFYLKVPIRNEFVKHGCATRWRKDEFNIQLGHYPIRFLKHLSNYSPHFSNSGKILIPI